MPTCAWRRLAAAGGVASHAASADSDNEMECVVLVVGKGRGMMDNLMQMLVGHRIMPAMWPRQLMSRVSRCAALARMAVTETATSAAHAMARPAPR